MTEPPDDLYWHQLFESFRSYVLAHEAASSRRLDGETFVISPDPGEDRDPDAAR